MTGCSLERARRALEEHSAEVAINCILDELEHEPSKVQKISHTAPSAPSSSPSRSAFTSVGSTASKSVVNQGTMVQLSSPLQQKGTFANIQQQETNNNQPGAELSEDEQMRIAIAASLETASQPVAALDRVVSAGDRVCLPCFLFLDAKSVPEQVEVVLLLFGRYQATYSFTLIRMKLCKRL
jgi:hypothetical protein